MNRIKKMFLMVLLVVFSINQFSYIGYTDKDVDWKTAYKEFILDYENNTFGQVEELSREDYKLLDTPGESGDIIEISMDITDYDMDDEGHIQVQKDNAFLLDITDSKYPDLIIQEDMFQFYSERWTDFSIYSFIDGEVIKHEVDYSKAGEYPDYHHLFYKKHEDDKDELIAVSDSPDMDTGSVVRIQWKNDRLVANLDESLEDDYINNTLDYEDALVDRDSVKSKHMMMDFLNYENTRVRYLKYPVLEEEMDELLAKYEDPVVEESEKEEEVQDDIEDEKKVVEEEKEDSKSSSTIIIGIVALVLVIAGLLIYRKKKEK